jgi:hypothetical protein
LRWPDKVIRRSVYASRIADARLIAGLAGEFIPGGTEVLPGSAARRWPGKSVVRAVVSTRGRGYQGLFQWNGSVPGGEVIEIRHVNLEILVDELVAEGNSERLQPGTNLVVRANAVRADEEDEVGHNRGSVGRI